MPHIHLEMTRGLVEEARTSDILRALVARLCSLPTIGSPAVKAYSTVYDKFAVGEGAAPGFVHLRVEILSGRGSSLVQEITDGMYSELKAQFAVSLTAGAVKATMELREMNTATYRK